MKTLLIVAAYLLFSPFLHAQEETPSEYSISFSFLGAYVDLNDEGMAGYSGFFEFSRSLNKNIVSFHVSTGFGITAEEAKIKNFQGYAEVDLLYSRRYKVNSFLVFEPQAGVGYISFGNTSEEENQNLVGFPVRLKMLAFTGKKFALGLSFGSNINTYRSLFSTNLVLHFNL